MRRQDRIVNHLGSDPDTDPILTPGVNGVIVMDLSVLIIDYDWKWGMNILFLGTVWWNSLNVFLSHKFKHSIVFFHPFFSPRQTGLWDHRPIGRSFPKPQADLCLWRGHAVGGERQADSRERSNQGQRGDAGGTPLSRRDERQAHLWDVLGPFELKEHLEGKKSVGGGRSEEDKALRNIFPDSWRDDQRQITLFSFNFLPVIKSNARTAMYLGSSEEFKSTEAVLRQSRSL